MFASDFSDLFLKKNVKFRPMIASAVHPPDLNEFASDGFCVCDHIFIKWIARLPLLSTHLLLRRPQRKRQIHNASNINDGDTNAITTKATATKPQRKSCSYFRASLIFDTMTTSC